MSDRQLSTDEWDGSKVYLFAEDAEPARKARAFDWLEQQKRDIECEWSENEKGMRWLVQDVKREWHCGVTLLEAVEKAMGA